MMIDEATNFTKGKNHALNNELAAARSYLMPFTEDEKFPLAYYYLALVEYRVGENTEAKKNINNFLRLKQQHRGGHILACRIALKANQLSIAKNHLEVSKKLRGKDDRIIMHLENEIKIKDINIFAKKTINDLEEKLHLTGSNNLKKMMLEAESLAKIEPIGNWSKDYVQAKIAHFHFASSTEKALQNYLPSALEKSVDFDYLSWPKRIQRLIRNKSVIDVGCGFGGYGLGFLAAGANSYTGLDPVLDLDTTRTKNKRTRQWDDMCITPNEIQAHCPDVYLFKKMAENLNDSQKFDIISLHNVTEHLMQLETVVNSLSKLCHRNSKIVFNHHNYYCWNGHHMSPNQVWQIEGQNGDDCQRKLMDWKHISYAKGAPNDHYIKTHLNRVTLKELRKVFEKQFIIEEWVEKKSSDETLERLTPEIEKYVYHHRKDLVRNDLEVNVVFAVLGVKEVY